MQTSVNAPSLHVEEMTNLSCIQARISWSLAQLAEGLTFHKIWFKFIHNVFGHPGNKQTVSQYLHMFVVAGSYRGQDGHIQFAHFPMQLIMYLVNLSARRLHS